MAKKNAAERSLAGKKTTPGVSLEKTVARIQQMMDPKSTVTHNEFLNDRVGNRRQYDVVIRGQFGGRPLLGVVECKDHSRKKGPESVEAFAKKTENLGANLRMIVSKKGFTKQALKLAQHENIGCLSLLPDDPVQIGFSVGDMWYGVIRMWKNIHLVINFAATPAPIMTFDHRSVKWREKPVTNWFLRELFTTHSERTKEGEYVFELTFDEQRDIEIEGKEYPVTGVGCVATYVCQKKRKWVSWTGDAFFDWHTGRFTTPPGGRVVGSAVESDLSAWPNYDGEIPDTGDRAAAGFIQAVLYYTQKWDNSQDSEVPDLRSL